MMFKYKISLFKICITNFHKYHKRIITGILTIFLIFVLSSCGDSPPVDYILVNFVQGYLIVDNPINEIIVQRSMPIQDTFKMPDAIIRDADVRIYDGSTELKLQFQSDSTGYFYPDTNYKVKPLTKYKLVVKIKDGTEVSAETTTPERIYWIREPKSVIYFPKDTLKLPTDTSLDISWTHANNLVTESYILKNTCLDTIGYGKYLSIQTSELNRRVGKKEQFSRRPNDVNTYAGPFPLNTCPVVWNIFKWYGLQKISILAPDINYYNWFSQTQRSSTYNYNLSNIKNGGGVFCSASMVSKEYFVMKNRP
ncbi:MAG: DUF4249 family protein [Candidatus Kapabacteria bacterium]|nr:DUF4249 family protein [Candidatus Kapabacteria bacterium]